MKYKSQKATIKISHLSKNQQNCLKCSFTHFRFCELFCVFFLLFNLGYEICVFFKRVNTCSMQLMHSFKCCGELMTSKKIKCVNHEAQVPLYLVSFVYTKLNSCREYRIQSPEWKSKCFMYACVRKSQFRVATTTAPSSKALKSIELFRSSLVRISNKPIHSNKPV